MLSSANSGDLYGTLSSVQSLAKQPCDTAEALTEVLSTIRQTVSNFDLSNTETPNLRGHVPELMAGLDETYMTLRARIVDWQTRDLMTPPNQHELRETFRVLRFAKDMLGEIWIDFDQIEDPKALKRAFTGTHLNTNVHPNYLQADTVPFQSGDVIIMRGMHNNSAAIAMIGDTDSQFSHVAMVYVDPQGRHWVVESLIATGAHIIPLEESLSSGAARAILLRHRDPALAAAAAKLIYDHVSESLDGRAGRILYDFSMRLDGGRRLFCSKLIRQAFSKASKKSLQLPTYGTVLGMKNRDFFKRIGVKTRHTFAPGDLEIEPEFDLVAEWRDYRATEQLRRQDIVMAKFFEWMDTRNYMFRETLVIRLISAFGRLSGVISETAKNMIEDVIPRVPRNMTRRAIAAVTMLHKTAEPVVVELGKLEEEHIAKTSVPMHPDQLRHHLENLRANSDGQIGYLHRIKVRSRHKHVHQAAKTA